jgi:hypothetical protein
VAPVKNQFFGESRTNRFSSLGNILFVVK